MRQHFKRYTELRLLFRCVAFAGACYFYVTQKEAFIWLAGGNIFSAGVAESNAFVAGSAGMRWFMGIVWLVLGLGMFLRYLPSRIESMGCQKQFAQFFVKRDTGSNGNRQREYNSRQDSGVKDNRDARFQQEKRKADLGALGTLALWCSVNGLFYLLYFRGILNDGHMVLLCLFYGVCDMVCILYICPFRVLIMRNRCCTTCRIYNWDAIMMMTPVLLSRNRMIRNLNLLALGLFLRWEWNWKQHPERFLEVTNGALSCGTCEHPASCAGCLRRKVNRK